MAGVQAKALFDFASGGQGELSFSANEVLTIVRQDVGGGWWEAANNRGESGLVPESYLEITQVPEPKMPPPPVPTAFAPSAWQQSSTSGARASKTKPPSQQVAKPQDEPDDDWDDEWDDDDDNSSVGNPEANRGPNDPNGNHGVVRRRQDKAQGQGGNVRITLNRFSQFARTGVDSYLFETVNVPESEKTAVIVVGSHGPMWRKLDHPFGCIITSPKKESKFHGIKTYIAYQLTPSFSNIQVSRRYKHFDWLQQRLAVKFSVLAVPSLPEKQIAGRFEDDFVNQRLRQLQLWVDRMCQHPVIAQSDVLHHFLTCTDEKKWKVGKRKAEKDEYCGGKFFLTVKMPDQHVDGKKSENDIENFGKLMRNMDESVRRLFEVGDSNTKKHEGPFKKEFQKLGEAFNGLARSFAFDERTVAQSLTTAIENTGQTYNDIGQMFEKQPPNDMHFLLEGLHEYRGLLSSFPETLMVQKSAMTKVQEGAAKLSESEQELVLGRADVVTYTVLSEIENFNRGRVVDFKGYMQKYVGGQIEFYKQITAKLEDALSKIDRA